EILAAIQQERFMYRPKKDFSIVVEYLIRRIIRRPDTLYVVPTFGLGEGFSKREYAYIYETELSAVLNSPSNILVVECGALKEDILCSKEGEKDYIPLTVKHKF